MNQLETLSRRLHIIRFVDKPFRYPSKQDIVVKLKEIGLKAVSERSIERDIKAIQDEYGIAIRNSRSKGGYFADRPADEDPADFEQVLQLLERRERIKFLQTAVEEVPHSSRFLQLEQAPPFTGVEHLPVLWEALRTGRCVQFAYQKFNNSANGQTRRVEPGLLFEYRKRWYLDGFDLTSHGPRTYGLDRIYDLTLTKQPIVPTDRNRTDRQHVIGVTSPENARPERVVLRFSVSEANYPRTLPMHSSQRLLQETNQFVDFELVVILNAELEREILAYGDYVEVVEPMHLREKVMERIVSLSRRYFIPEKI